MHNYKYPLKHWCGQTLDSKDEFDHHDCQAWTWVLQKEAEEYAKD